jgi:putative membrane protein
MHDGDAGWMIVMMFVMLLFWAAVILGIAWLARGGFDRSRGGRRETPTEILDRRFAEGAISVEDYQERLKVLKS